FGSDREGGDKLDVFAMNADGKNAHALTSFAPPIEGGDTNFSGDGAKITFERDVGGKKQSDPNAPAEVWLMNADGSDAASTGEACSDVGCAPRFNPVDAHEIALVKSDAGVHHVYLMRIDDAGKST